VELVRRNHCIISGNEDLELLYSFKDFPVFMGCVEHSSSEDIKVNMDWWISKSTGSLQLNPLIPLEVLYQQQHADSVGTIWKQHHQAFAEFIVGFGVNDVFEIGGAHGILSKNYKSLVEGARWTILEPNPRPVDGVDAEIIQGFFDEHFSLDRKVDAVVHSHVMEHIYEPKLFVENLSRFIDEDGLLLFSIPNMHAQLRSYFTNCLNFEHSDFLIEMFVDYLLESHGFLLVKKEYFLGHSVFYAAVKRGGVRSQSLPNLYEYNKKLFEDFVDYHIRLVRDINNRLETIKGNVYLFGAHIFSQYLIGFGLDVSKVKFVLDNAKEKQKKRLYGTNFQVSSPKILEGDNEAIVILKAGIYNEEIKADIISNINPNVAFIE